MENKEYDKSFLRSNSLENAKELLNDIYAENPDAIVIVEEEGKECLIEHNKQLNFVPNGGKKGQILIANKDGNPEWVLNDTSNAYIIEYNILEKSSISKIKFDELKDAIINNKTIYIKVEEENTYTIYIDCINKMDGIEMIYLSFIYGPYLENYIISENDLQIISNKKVIALLNKYISEHEHISEVEVMSAKYILDNIKLWQNGKGKNSLVPSFGNWYNKDVIFENEVAIGNLFSQPDKNITVDYDGSSEKPLFLVGNGHVTTDDDGDHAEYHNAFEIRQSGDIYISNTYGGNYFYFQPMIHLQGKLKELENKSDIFETDVITPNSIDYNTALNIINAIKLNKIIYNVANNIKRPCLFSNLPLDNDTMTVVTLYFSNGDNSIVYCTFTLTKNQSTNSFTITKNYINLQKKLTAGKNIEITSDNTINCTLDNDVVIIDEEIEQNEGTISYQSGLKILNAFNAGKSIVLRSKIQNRTRQVLNIAHVTNTPVSTILALFVSIRNTTIQQINLTIPNEESPCSYSQSSVLIQQQLTAGKGIKINQSTNEISVNLDTTPFIVVDSLPEAPASGNENKLHLVKANNTEVSPIAATVNNVFDEFLYVNGSWELLGQLNAEIDLNDYVKTSELEEKIKESGEFVTFDDVVTRDKAGLLSVEANNNLNNNEAVTNIGFTSREDVLKMSLAKQSLIKSKTTPPTNQLLDFPMASSTGSGAMTAAQFNKLEAISNEWYGTQDEYDNLDNYDENTKYYIYEE